MILLPTFEAEIAGSTVLHPVRLLLGIEVRSNRVQTTHNGISILVFFSLFGVEVSLIRGFRTGLLIGLFPKRNGMLIRFELALLFVRELGIAMEGFG